MNVASLGERLVKIMLVGRLDTPGVDRVETRFVAHIVPDGNSAVIDLSSVDFVASMGIRMLVSAARSLHARQAKLALYGAQQPVLQVFEAVALQKIMPIPSQRSRRPPGDQLGEQRCPQTSISCGFPRRWAASNMEARRCGNS
jgi:anti-anti-sigma factor